MKPKVLLFCVVFGPASSARFNAFDADARISRFARSRTGKFLSSAMSSFTDHGVRRYDILRGVSPYTRLGGSTNAAGFRYGTLNATLLSDFHAGLISGIEPVDTPGAKLQRPLL